jgi:hypothetical protein
MPDVDPQRAAREDARRTAKEASRPALIAQAEAARSSDILVEGPPGDLIGPAVDPAELGPIEAAKIEPLS